VRVIARRNPQTRGLELLCSSRPFDSQSRSVLCESDRAYDHVCTEGAPLDITINTLNVNGNFTANRTLTAEHMPRIEGKIVASIRNTSVQWSPYASQEEVRSIPPLS
jgi:hypothetical protein